MTEKLRILLIEDNPDAADLISEMLPKTGRVSFDIECAPLLSQAITRLGSGDINLVILDLHLPDSDGLDTFRKVQSAASNLPIIILTGNGDEETAIAAVREGAQDYLVKGEITINLLVRTACYAVERKRTETMLRESEERYRTIFNNAILGIFQSTPDGRLLDVNPALAHMMGFNSPEEMKQVVTDIGKQIYVNPKDREVLRGLLETVGEVRNFESESIRKDGKRIWTSLNARCVRDASGSILLIEGTVEDITKRKQAEAESHLANERLQYLILSASAVIYSAKPYGDYGATFISNSVSSMVGYESQEFTQNPDFWFNHIHPEDQPIVGYEISRLLEKNRHVYEYRFQRKDGEYIWVRDDMKLIRDEKGQPLEIVGFWSDVTELVRAEDALGARTVELESLFTISTSLHSARNADEMLPKALGEIRRVLKADAGAVILLSPDDSQFTIALADGPLTPNIGRRFGRDQGICGQVLLMRQPYVTSDYAADSLCISDIRAGSELGPAVLVPFQSESDFLGVLMAVREKGPLSSPFTPAEVRLLTAIGEMVGNALHRVGLHDQALTRLQHVQALHSIDMAINASLDLHVILDILLSKITSLLGVDAAAVLLLYPEILTLKYEAWLGFHTKAIKGVVLRLGEGYAGRAAIDRRHIHVPNLTEAGDDPARALLPADEGFITYYGMPLITKGQVKGVLETFHRSPHAITDEWVEFLAALAAQAAIAIDNAQIFNDLQRSNIQLSLAYDTTLEGWTHALDLRDKESEGHTLRVIKKTLRLAQSIGMDREQIVHIRRGALLHDIGKMAIPDAILLKPDKLTEEEWAIMRQHPQYAHDLLSRIPYLRSVVDIPYCHHEKWDGTGYPRGLKSEAIPLPARLFAIVDVWDALTSNRPYRTAWTREQAYAYILEQAGKHFDPNLVDLFSKIVPREP